MRMKADEAFVIIDSTDRNPELLERSGFKNPDLMVYVETARERILLANIRDFSQAESGATVDRVLPEEPYKERGEADVPEGTPNRRCLAALHALLAELGVRTCFVQAEHFPYAAAVTLKRLGYDIRVLGLPRLSRDPKRRLVAQEATAKADVVIGAPFTNADLCYATRILATAAPVVFVQTPRERIIVAAAPDADRFPRARVVTYEAFASRKRVFPSSLPSWRTMEALHAVLAESGVSTVVVQIEFPYAHARALERLGYTVEWRDPYFPQRAVKTTEEIAAIRSVMHCAEGAMQTARDLIRSSRIEAQRYLWIGEGKNARVLTSEMVKETIAAHCTQRGCGLPHGVIVACGEHAAQPHHEGTGALRARQPIIIDIFPRSKSTGYWGDMTRTFCRGLAPERLRKMYAAVREAQETAMAALRPGACGQEPHRIAEEVFTQRGFSRETANNKPQGFIHGLAHGVGIELHELPVLNKSSKNILAKGNVVTPEPGLYYPGFGGVRLEDTVVITESGYKNLTTFPKDEWEL